MIKDIMNHNADAVAGQKEMDAEEVLPSVLSC